MPKRQNFDSIWSKLLWAKHFGWLPTEGSSVLPITNRQLQSKKAKTLFSQGG